MSTCLPVNEFSMNAALFTSTGFCGFKVCRRCIQAFSASSGLSEGSMPSASAARCGVVVALVKTRSLLASPLMRSNSSAGHSGVPAATSVMPPSSYFWSAPLMRRSAPSSSTCLMKPRKSL